MRTFIRSAAATALVLAGLVPAGASDGDAGKGLKSCYIKGMKERVQCMTVSVPLDYAAPDGVQIDLNVAVVPAVSGNPAPDPLFVFAGGPGQAAGEFGALIDTAFDDIHAGRDIILMDQRGTGKSNPLQCEMGESFELAEITERVTDCHAKLTIDARHFTMENVMRDTDLVRERLGYDKLNLWGGSWGTRSALLYLKRYPDHVRSLILDGILPPEVAFLTSTPKSAERAKAKMAAACAASAACTERYGDLNEQIAKLAEKAEAGELHYKGQDLMSGEPLDMPIRRDTAMQYIRAILYAADATVVLPYTVAAANEGDLKPMLAAMSGGQAMSDSLYIGSSLSILCGEEVPRVTADEVKAAGEGSFAEDADYRFWAATCAAWPALPPAPDAFDATPSDIPVLALSGDLDPVTPPTLATPMLERFPNSAHIIVPGNGHISSAVGCVPSVMAGFIKTLDTKAVDTTCVAGMERLPFITGINGTVQ